MKITREHNVRTIGDAYGLGRDKITQTYMISTHEERLFQFADAY